MSSSQKLLQLLVAACFVSLIAARSVKCPDNSLSSCKPPCFNTCDNLNATSCKKSCESTCHCTEGYVFQSEESHICVPVSSCNVTCPARMIFRECTRTPQVTCSTLGIHYVPGEKCMPHCVCTEGYVLTDEDIPQCIKSTKCPQPTLNH
ncbi:chymotrypsin inhibitor Ani s 6-like [Eleutherodactylus coqui]|uniref:chymotrypsin inhibitor Ani s 6-like n=1 Tax=Eleutherodactylus coqui TaxID=57060 RepID=UPI003461CD74